MSAPFFLISNIWKDFYHIPNIAPVGSIIFNCLPSGTVVISSTMISLAGETQHRLNPTVNQP